LRDCGDHLLNSFAYSSDRNQSLIVNRRNKKA